MTKVIVFDKLRGYIAGMKRGLYNLFLPLPDYIEAKPEMYRVRNMEAINKSMQLVKLQDMSR
jgi:hypothetical protein